LIFCDVFFALCTTKIGHCFAYPYFFSLIHPWVGGAAVMLHTRAQVSSPIQRGVFKEFSVPFITKTPLSLPAFTLPSVAAALSAHSSELQASNAVAAEGLVLLPVRRSPCPTALQAAKLQRPGSWGAASSTQFGQSDRRAMLALMGGDEKSAPKSAASTPVLLGSITTDSPDVDSVFGAMHHKPMASSRNHNVGNLIAGRLGPLKPGVFTNCVRLEELKKKLAPELRGHAAVMLKCLNNLDAALPEQHKDKIETRVGSLLEDDHAFQAHFAAYASAVNQDDTQTAATTLLAHSPYLAKALAAAVNEAAVEFLTRIHPTHDNAV
jgi:hypothetical protein